MRIFSLSSTHFKHGEASGRSIKKIRAALIAADMNSKGSEVILEPDIEVNHYLHLYR